MELTAFDFGSSLTICSTSSCIISFSYFCYRTFSKLMLTLISGSLLTVLTGLGLWFELEVRFTTFYGDLERFLLASGLACAFGDGLASVLIWVLLVFFFKVGDLDWAWDFFVSYTFLLFEAGFLEFEAFC